MAIYRAGKNRKRVIEEILKDLDPGLREAAREILENMSYDELTRLEKSELYSLVKKRLYQRFEK